MRLGGYTPSDELVSRTGQRHFASAGRYIAYEDYTVGQDGSRYRVKTVDLRTGRTLFAIPDGALPAGTTTRGTSFGIGPTTAIEVRATGGTGWIARDAYASTSRLEVHKLDASGAALLDQGAAIAPDSLALVGAALTWMNDGTLQSAALR